MPRWRRNRRGKNFEKVAAQETQASVFGKKRALAIGTAKKGIPNLIQEEGKAPEKGNSALLDWGRS